MKKTGTLILLLCTMFFVQAQTNSREALFTKMADELCKEINAKDSVLKKSEQLDMELGFLMLPLFSKYEEDLKKLAPGFELEDEVEKLGEEIGKKLAINCPAFLTLISNNPGFIESVKGEGAPAVQQLEGTLLNISPGEFTAIQIKLASGKTEKIWWMEYFAGEEKLKNPSLVNKKIRLSFIEKEVYNAAIKDYVKIKIAAGID